MFTLKSYVIIIYQWGWHIQRNCLVEIELVVMLCLLFHSANLSMRIITKVCFTRLIFKQCCQLRKLKGKGCVRLSIANAKLCRISTTWNRLRWFRHVERRHANSVVRRVDQMEGSQITRGRGRPRKTIRETIKKDLDVNELERNMVFDRTLCLCLVHIADPT